MLGINFKYQKEGSDEVTERTGVIYKSPSDLYSILEGSVTKEVAEEFERLQKALLNEVYAFAKDHNLKMKSFKASGITERELF